MFLVTDSIKKNGDREKKNANELLIEQLKGIKLIPRFSSLFIAFWFFLANQGLAQPTVREHWQRLLESSMLD